MTIFVSYSRHDSEVVKELIRGLEAARKSVWVDQALHGGDSWWDVILKTISESRVFVFALSDESLKSKPCRAELDYAIALEIPILPVRVGMTSGIRTNPVAKLQVLPYRPDDALSAFALIAAVDDAARRRKPLPHPLPPAPAIPFAYLLGMEAKIDSEEFPRAEQAAVVDRLRAALDEETDASVRADIKRMLDKLRRKPWIAVATDRAITLILNGAEESLEERPEGGRPDAQVPPAGWYPDPAGGHEWRWFDKTWTRWVSDQGIVGEQPLR